MAPSDGLWITEEHFQAANKLAVSGMQVRYYHTDAKFDHLMVTLARGDLAERTLLGHIKRLLPDWVVADYKYDTSNDIHGHDQEVGTWTLRLEKPDKPEHISNKGRGPFMTTREAGELIGVTGNNIVHLRREGKIAGSPTTVSRWDVIYHRHRQYRAVLLPLTGPQHSYAMQSFFNNPYLDLTRIKYVDVINLWNEYVVLEHSPDLKVIPYGGKTR